MTSGQIIDISKPVLAKYGVVKSDLFGSFARGDYDDQSDIDLLVDVPQGTSLFDLIYLKEDLEKALNRSVDVVTYRSINKHVRKYIFANTRKVL